jgi:hypothetical protein
LLWTAIRLLWIAISLLWTAIRLLWIAISLLWTAIRLLWIAISLLWTAIRLLWIAISLLWTAIRLLFFLHAGGWGPQGCELFAQFLGTPWSGREWENLWISGPGGDLLPARPIGEHNI